MGLLLLSLTCLVLSAVSYLLPGVADAGLVFGSGSVVSTVIAGGFAAYVWRAGL